jgi:hypothetical protein
VAKSFRQALSVTKVARWANFGAAHPAVKRVVAPLDLRVFHSNQSPIIVGAPIARFVDKSSRTAIAMGSGAPTKIFFPFFAPLRTFSRHRKI